MSYTLFKFKTDNIRLSDSKDVKEVALALGISAAPPDGRKQIGWTIAMDPSLKILLKPRGTITYGQLTPLQQYRFLLEKYIPTVVAPFVDYGVIVPELQKNGNIHLHLICSDDVVKGKMVDIISLQKTVGQTTFVRKITKGKKQKEVVLNYIHYLDNIDEWMNYMNKDELKDDNRFGIYYFSKI